MSVRINPSILSADSGNFQAEFESIASADLVHVDVMDNHFVPNLTFGLPVVARMQQYTPKPLDVHLMISDTDRWALGYAEIGAYSVTFHAESTDQPVALARRIRAAGARAGIAVKPGTAIEPYLEMLSEFDQLLVMTVEQSGCRLTAASTRPTSSASLPLAQTPSWPAAPSSRAPTERHKLRP